MAMFLRSFAIKNNALSKKDLPTKIKILNWGKNSTVNGDVILNDDSLQYFDVYQEKTGRDKNVPIDFDHNTVKDSKTYVPGMPKHIAGYGDPELIKGDGLYLKNIQWTPSGQEYGRD